LPDFPQLLEKVLLVELQPRTLSVCWRPKAKL
jgi:hypothetical protein